MSQVNFISRWKIQLETSDIKKHVVVLLEVLEMFSKTKDEELKSFYLSLINSDICHFLSSIMSYSKRSAMYVLTKVISKLSEADEFFKNDFHRIIKGYLRVIHSIPSATEITEDVEAYHQNIFSSVTSLVKR